METSSQAFTDFAEGSSAFATDLQTVVTFLEPFVKIAEGLSQLVGMFV
ncbi:Hypothetical protein NG00_01821 [Corynebacterium camporealensis]|uniref:Uncharacterized protein n=1 Tax=Corynebacterium camporealensis TaxID=161896 RepID=A0A0F6QXG6_9CORY|nr:hypothetical protein [Corynebacterium camporealensis]AKE39967.1 hypothetical protein UL81_10165 [Corynebacterium camporealensis]AVH89060.1 Hypothetical protein NG00_01821 [Corynebacterium camporealensis]